MVLGLAPAAHGGNRTGRVFTGDRSGDFLFASLHRTGFANQPTSVSADDGLRLNDAFIAAVNRCAPPANKPTPQERDTCLPYLEREIEALADLRVIVALGSFAWDGALQALKALGHAVAAEAALRSRRRGRRRSVHADRVLPPEPAEHVHGQADARDDGRGVQSISGPGDGSGGSGPGVIRCSKPPIPGMNSTSRISSVIAVARIAVR